MVTVSLGNKKRTYPSIKAFADDTGINYMTAYMRLRFGKKPSTVAKKPVRKYVRKDH